MRDTLSCISLGVFLNDIYFAQMLFLDSLVFIRTMSTALNIHLMPVMIAYNAAVIMVDNEETAFFSINIKIEISWKTLLNCHLMWQYIIRTKYWLIKSSVYKKTCLALQLSLRSNFRFWNPCFQLMKQCKLWNKVIPNTTQYLCCICSWDFTLKPLLLLLFKWQAADWNIRIIQMHARSKRLAACWVILQSAFDSKVVQVITTSYSSLHEYSVSMLLSSFKWRKLCPRVSRHLIMHPQVRIVHTDKLLGFFNDFLKSTSVILKHFKLVRLLLVEINPKKILNIWHAQRS